MIQYYDIDGVTPLDVGSERAVELWSDQGLRRVRYTKLEYRGHQLTVSTVFLVMDHGFGGGPPVLWETMIFSETMLDWNDEPQARYTSLVDARLAHARVVTAALTHGATLVSDEVGSVYKNPAT